MSTDEQHVALPKLYGAPAYGRPPRTFDAQPRPLDLDDLPLEAARTEDDRGPSDGLGPPGADGTGAMAYGRTGPSNGEPRLEARPFSLRSLGRILSGRP